MQLIVMLGSASDKLAVALRCIRYVYVCVCKIKSAHKLNQQRTPLLIIFAYIIKIDISKNKIRETFNSDEKTSHIILISRLSLERKTYKYKLILPVK